MTRPQQFRHFVLNASAGRKMKSPDVPVRPARYTVSGPIQKELTMRKNKTRRRKVENYRTFELRGQTIIVDDFIYRRIFKDPDIKPFRKYTFIKGFQVSHDCPRLVLKNEKKVTLSRYIMRAGKGELVDHKNRNSSDNRRCNLRIVNGRQNALNRKIKNNTGLISVAKHTTRNYLSAHFTAKGNRKLCFNCPDTPFNRILAALAHDKFVLQAGEEEFAPLNFPNWRFEPYRSFLLKTDLGKYKESAHSRPTRS